MVDLEKIDRKIQGWGLQLDDAEIEKLLEHLLWDCISSDEFRQRCEFVFNQTSLVLTWQEQKRSAKIRLKDGREIEASV